MINIYKIIFIAIALSMDAFALSLSLGTIGTIKNFKLSFFVGIMHFIMPILGLNLGTIILSLLPINPNIVAGLILSLIGINMLFSVKKQELKNIFGFYSYFLFALSVSIDSFTVGIGFGRLTNHHLLTALIFSIFSFSFTFLGLKLGKYIHQKLGIYSTILGVLIIFIIAIQSICK